MYELSFFIILTIMIVMTSSTNFDVNIVSAQTTTQQQNQTTSAMTTATTSSSIMISTTSSVPVPTTTTTTPSPPPQMTYHDWQILMLSWDFLRGVQRKAFDMCHDEFFNECQPAMHADRDNIFQKWDHENYRCAPSWCACYDGYIRVLGNTTYCLLPQITGGLPQVCHELEICKPIRLRCADDFVYIQNQLPAQCGSFVNCTLKPTVLKASVDQCESDWRQCDTSLACQVQKDPLNDLPPPGTPAPWQWDKTLPQALRDIWIVTASVFGLVLIVAIVSVVLMRRRQREWQQWYEEASEMAMERADDVVWFEPEKEDDDEDDDDDKDENGNQMNEEEKKKKKDEDDPSAVAPSARRPRDLSCIRCGKADAPIQLLPCHCRWCGCSEPDTYNPPSLSSPTSQNPRSGNTTTTDTEENSTSAALISNAERNNNNTNSNSTTSETDPSSSSNNTTKDGEEVKVDVSSLSCSGVPKFTRKIAKSIVDQFEERERERQRQTEQEDEQNPDEDRTSRARRRHQQQRTAAKPPRPKCDRCHRVVNFAVNFQTLFYPAASQDVSEDGGNNNDNQNNNNNITAAITMSPREVEETTTSPSQQQHSINNDDDDQQQQQNDNTNEGEPSPLTTAAVSSLSSNNENSSRGKKIKKKVPTCCICLSEPCSVAIIPCGHVAQCVQCAKKLCVPVARADTDRRTFVISAKCPLCREDIIAMASLSKNQNKRAFEKSASAMGE